MKYEFGIVCTEHSTELLIYVTNLTFTKIYTLQTLVLVVVVVVVVVV